MNHGYWNWATFCDMYMYWQALLCACKDQTPNQANPMSSDVFSCVRRLRVVITLLLRERVRLGNGIERSFRLAPH